MRDNDLYDDGLIIFYAPDENFVCDDLNGDGKKDLAFGGPGRNSGFIEIYGQEGINQFTREENWMGTNGNNHVDSLIINKGDSLPGLVSFELYSGDVYVYRNDGNFAFTEIFKYQFNTRIFGMEAEDFDNDGDDDFLIAKGWENIHLFENRNGVDFPIAYVSSYSGVFFNFIPVDLNSDLKLDFIAAAFHGQVFYYENKGNLDFLEKVSDVSAIENYGLTIGDFDGDGLLSRFS